MQKAKAKMPPSKAAAVARRTDRRNDMRGDSPLLKKRKVLFCHTGVVEMDVALLFSRGEAGHT